MPVVALPCGSESITRIRRSLAASAAATLMAVVVFPTPPFWLLMARILPKRPSYHESVPTTHRCKTWGAGLEPAWGLSPASAVSRETGTSQFHVKLEFLPIHRYR